MPGGNTEQRQRRSLRTPATLFPIAQRVNTDSKGLRKLGLGQPDETPKRDDIRAARNASAQDSLALPARDDLCEVLIG